MSWVLRCFAFGEANDPRQMSSHRQANELRGGELVWRAEANELRGGELRGGELVWKADRSK